MSKLDENERWKSKMLLTEHVEQYEQQHLPHPGKIITAEERTMLRDCILLPYMETMVQKSIAEIEYSTNILKRLYLAAGQYILELIMKDLYRLRRELKQRNIRILTEEQSDLVVYHYFYCRGYKERFGMTRDVMKAEIRVRLTKYVDDMSELLKSNNK